jgi:cellulase/cellobiase CelA1
MNQLKSCEDSLSARCGKFVRQAQAASYQQDKALSRTRVIWFHLHTEMKGLVMKSYRNAAAASVLALALAVSAFAGEIHTGFTDPDPQPTPSPTDNTAQTITTDGEMHTGAAETLTQIALDVLAALPSLP